MNACHRRVFLLRVAAVGASAPSVAFAQAGAHVDEASEQAVALGYRHDSATVDAKKYPQHAATQVCGGCSFWQGAASDPWAGCAMFGRKQVAHGGWCMAWAKPPGK